MAHTEPKRTALLEEQKRLQAARWTEESREGLEEMRRFFETHGRFSDEPGKL